MLHLHIKRSKTRVSNGLVSAHDINVMIGGQLFSEPPTGQKPATTEDNHQQFVDCSRPSQLENALNPTSSHYLGTRLCDVRQWNDFDATPQPLPSWLVLRPAWQLLGWGAGSGNRMGRACIVFIFLNGVNVGELYIQDRLSSCYGQRQLQEVTPFLTSRH